MKLKLALLLPALMVAFMSTPAFAEDKDYKQAERDWHNAIETFLQEVKVAEGFDYHASENSNLWTALDIEVKRLGNEEENVNKGYFFFMCKAHKKVMRQFHSASYDLVKLSGICASSGLAAENWVSTGKNDRGEYFRDMASIKSEGDFVVVKDKIVFAEQQNIDSLIHQIRITGYAVDCNAKTAASTSYSYNNLGGEVITAFEIPRSKWSFDSEGYKVLGMAGVCILSGTPTTLSKLESLKIAANGGDALAQYTLGLMFLNGKDASKDVSKALEWLHKAAAQNHGGAQGALFSMYMLGDEVPKNEAKGVEWGLKAAAQGSAGDQFLVGSSYMFGRGVIKDYVRAYAWFNLAAAQGEEAAIKARDYLEKYKLTADQRAEGQRLASRWRKGNTFLTPDNKQETMESSPSALESEASPKLSSTGSGFVVSTSGHLLTNHHVANGCSNLKIRDSSKIEHAVTVVATDAKSDLALLKMVHRHIHCEFLSA